MNQTKKRLSIISLAISINDTETVQLQVLKLSLLKTDSLIQEILEILQAQNYAQAQGLIASYIKKPNQGVVQRSMQEEPAISPEDQAIIDEFDLFVIPKKAKKKKKKQRPIEAVDVDSFLDINMDDVLAQSVPIAKTQNKQDSFFDQEDSTKAPMIDTTDIPKDTFFDNIPTQEDTLSQEKIQKKQIETVQTTEEVLHKEEPKVESILDDTSIKEEPIPSEEAQQETLSFGYAPILHLEQKMISMKNLYPTIDNKYEQFSTVEALMHKLIHEHYTEQEIEETLMYAMKLIEQEATLEATQLILVCAGTESKLPSLFLQENFIKERFSKKIRLKLSL